MNGELGAGRRPEEIAKFPQIVRGFHPSLTRRLPLPLTGVSHGREEEFEYGNHGDGNRSSALQSYNSQLSAAEQQKMAYQMQLEQALANGSAEILQNKYDTLQNLDNAYAQQILALQQAAAQAAQKRW